MLTLTEILELLARVDELTTEELANVRAAIPTAAAELGDTAEDVTTLGTLADGLDSVVAREGALQAESDERAAAREAALQRINGGPADGDGDGTDGTDGDADADADADAPVDADREPVTAGGTPRPAGRTPGVGRRTPAPADRRPAYTAPRAENALVAGADLSGVAAGSEFESRAQLAEALNSKRESLGNRPHGKVIVASAKVTYPESRTLTRDPVLNEQRIRATIAQENMVAAAAAANHGQPTPIVAAGGLCAPVENLYDVNVLGVADRPVRAALTQFAAGRGGINFRSAPTFAELDGATGFWTMTDDENVDDTEVGDEATPHKQFMEVICNDGETAYVESVYTRLRFRNVSARFDPEMTAANIEAANIAAARKAENRLLNKLAASSTTVTTAAILGATRDLLAAVDHVTAAYRSQHRLNDAVALRAIMPRWIEELIRTDVARSMGSVHDLEALAVAQAQIIGWFTRRNINPTFHLDGRAAITAATNVPAMAAQAYGPFVEGGPVPGYPDQVEWFLYPEGDVLFLDGGTLDLGLVRDSRLNAVNKYETFTEAWEGLANRSEQSLRIVSTVQPTGQVAGTKDTSAVND